jgi:hypothetical protein
MARGAILISNEVPFLWEWLPATIIAARCRSHRTEKGDFIGSRAEWICHFDHREKSPVFNALLPKDFSLRSK